MTTDKIVVIDGPSGSGKSTVSRAAAAELGWSLLDTGSVYRALTWFALQRGVDLTDQDAVVALLPEFFSLWQLSTRPNESWVRVGDTDVSDAIRTTEISAVVSHVATNLRVREAVNKRFREILAGAAESGIIAEGRDLTTVVAPDAPVRILITASEAERIRRRQAERGSDNAAAVAATISERDVRDATVSNFTSAAAGVIEIDTTELDLDTVIATVVDIIRKAQA